MIKKILFSLLLLLVALPVSSQEVTDQVAGEQVIQETQEVQVFTGAPVVAAQSIIAVDNTEIPKVRNLDSLSFLNFIPYALFATIDQGLPAETLVLILMIPLLTTLIVLLRNIVGIPSLDMLVIIAFSIALLASNLIIGTVLLFTILFSSMAARILLKKVKIMQLPKISLSMMIVSLSVLLMLSFLAFSQLISLESLSIVPILLLIILSERIVRLEFERKPRQVWTVVISSLTIGLFGYFLLLSDMVRTVVLNYPELILLLVPINLLMGRYFGLRLAEYYRFKELFDKPKAKKVSKK